MGHGEEEESDIFSIQEVSFQPSGDSEWRENSYTLNTDSLDWVRAEVPLAAFWTGWFCQGLGQHQIILFIAGCNNFV